MANDISNEEHNQQPPKGFPVVAIGASAGGLEAVRELFENLAPDTGLSYVYIQHLDPTHQSMLSTILARATKMKVQEAQENMKMERNNVYIIPPNKEMAVVDGTITLNPRSPKPKANMPIDKFFISLAEKHKEGALGVILSGNANDGTAGLKAIKQAGGITFAQNETAKFDSMPKSAINEGVVDLVLPPAEIAKELERISKTPEAVEHVFLNENSIEDTDEWLVKIIELIKTAQGIDFTHYKARTIKRRIIRRMVLYKLEKLSDYHEYLKGHDDEPALLYQDMLIHVTSFFRDPDTIEFLKKTVLPKIIKSKRGNAPIRIWVPACSTGEEAYSLAISLMELKEEGAGDVPIQIFATDLSELAIAKARLGVYSHSDLADMSETRLNRFFVKIDGSYRISKTIREACVFAPHNIFKDPPFSRLDIISCCNLFIYLDNVLQKKIINTFYYALNPEGYLVLGKSETASSYGQLFTQLEKKFKVFSKKGEASVRSMFDMSYRIPNLEKPEKREVKSKSAQREEVPALEKAVNDILNERFTPACVIINQDMEILQFRGSTGLFLEPSPGKASFNLMKMARKELVFELRNIIHKASRSGNAEKKYGLAIRLKDKDYHVGIEAIPLKSITEEKLCLVIFVELQGAVINDPKVLFSKDEAIKGLVEELNAGKEDMRAIIEDQEAGKQELQSANEEIISSNEELQSINEELETSKEEIESANEELMSINSELQIRNDQLTEAEEYSDAIFEIMREAVIVLNQALCVRMANMAFYSIFRTRPEDTEDRQLFDIGNRQWDSPKLHDLLNKIAVDGTEFNGHEVEHDFPGIGKKIMLVNGRKITQKMQKKELILLAIEDITEQRMAQRVLEEREAWFKNIANNAPVMIWMTSPDLSRNFFNTTWLDYTGHKENEDLAAKWLEDIHAEDKANFRSIYTAATDVKRPFQIEYRLRRNDGEYRWVLDVGKPAYSAEGKFTGYIGSIDEVHDKKLAKEELEKKVTLRTHDLNELNKELQRSNSELQQFAYVASHDLQEPLRKILTFSDRLQQHKHEIPDGGKKYIEKISDSVKRMSVLIEDLLNFSRISLKDQKFSQVDLGELLKAVLADFDVIIKEKKAVVNISVPYTIEAVPVQMTQLFHNLISNALKFSKENMQPIISITANELSEDEALQERGLDEGKRYIKITVADNGIGFDDEFKEQIFIIFQRLNEMQRYPGTGIGLALCKKIADNHRGKISASSVEGNGAEFTVILPFSQN